MTESLRNQMREKGLSHTAIILYTVHDLFHLDFLAGKKISAHSSERDFWTSEKATMCFSVQANQGVSEDAAREGSG